MKFWIFCTVLFVVRSVTSQSSEVEQLIRHLAKNLSGAFNELKTFLNADDIASKIKTTPKLVNEKVATDILKKSKDTTESLVKKTSEVVDKIQQRVTSEYAEFSKSEPVQYFIDCSNTNYFYYFRSKVIKNGTYDLQNCSSPSMPFADDSLLENAKTNRQNSSVHIPTNVFDSSKEIQNVANYTEKVDETFVLSENKSYIKWQFFCSNTGFFKIYPGIKWHIQIEDMEKDPNKVDFFDCRSEQWFLESTSYPKKMIIMVDKSGSMKGRRRIIANHTIYEILNTITENDYFNVILFAKEHMFADNRTKEMLMQATEKNKRFIMDQLEIYFVPDGIAEYTVGLEESFKVLQNERNRENGSTVYNYLIMIITDGSPQTFQDEIDKGNKNINARIFTYLIGQASAEKDIVKQMACKNRGYAVEIATLADVKENVQKYLNVISRHNAIMQNSFYVWTGVHQYQMRPSLNHTSYVPIFNSPNVGLPTTMQYTTNISLMTTAPPISTMSSVYSNVTLPPPIVPTKIEVPKSETIRMFVTVSKAAYDVTNATAQKNLGLLLGAAGVDVPTSDFIKTAPFWKIGVNSYMFGVTHNGFAIFHPRFRPQDKNYVKYFYRNVDISELEIGIGDIIKEIYPNQTIPSSLRDLIMSIEPNSEPRHLEKRSTYDILDDYKTAFQVSRDYYATGIQGTSYKFGLAVPFNEQVPEYSKLKNFADMDLVVFSAELKANLSFCNQGTFLANQGGLAMKEYEFCNLNKEIAALMLMSPLCLLREIIANQTLRNECLLIPDSNNVSDEMVDTYLKSLYNEAEDTQNLASEWAAKDSKAASVSAQQIFSMHHFGLIRYYNYKNLSYEQFIADHNGASEDPLYRETVLTAQGLSNPSVLVVRPLPNNVVKNTSDEKMLVFTVSASIASQHEYKGIVGVQVEQWAYLKHLMSSPCTSGDCLSCSNTTVLDCYVITSSGLVVLNNINVGNTGELLTEIDCKLMESLVNSSIFKSQLLYDFQALCTKIPKVESFANILIDPFTKVFRLSIWLLYELFLILQNISVSSLLWSFTSQQETDQLSELPKPAPDNTNNDLNVNIYSSDAPFQPIINLFPAPKDSDEVNPPGTKSKRQHELFVKRTLEEKVVYCKKVENDFSACLQKAVTDICKLDKIHNGKQSDQHVEKLTSLNIISHCLTVCLMLQNDFPAIWQEQEDCRQPSHMCHTVAETFTSVHPASTLKRSVDTTPKEPPPSDPVLPTYFQYRQQIVSDGDVIVAPPVIKQPSSGEVMNGTICAELCPAKTWYAVEIENTNLILVIVHKKNPSCSCECQSSFGLKVEIKRNISNSIENPAVQVPNYFSDFLPFTKSENSTECNDDFAMSTMPLRSLMILLLVLFFLIVH